MELTSVADGSRNTPGKILQVNHAGEFGAINIYRAQIAVARLTGAKHLGLLEEFLVHEKEHHRIFGAELKRRGIRRCPSLWLCGVGGFVLGLISGLLGKNSVLACTAAVETVVLKHLREQLQALEKLGDQAAYDAVAKIVKDEEEHQQAGMEARQECIFYRPYYNMISQCTEAVIWMGMRL
ncbi:demethoxyubiquinone hydroxylase family protein [Hahella sp. HN01]|uniref:demethoxyubiquinone hydroxylase family protein n=1 Tax=Hahella sp. HN01 TaxID=2847262 RepID=UPI001C1EBE99|nr:demethoxyubiquinone hydroxylase family protein [Hahella sp. HN01]MBU6950111.1 demethoxyubiquinone hydroxylase family protein [Hahella sp. HN01]